MSPRTRQVLGLVATLLVVGLLWWAQDGGSTSSTSGTPTATTPTAHTIDGGAYDEIIGADTIALADLPAEGRAVVRAIHDGGPFRYSRDGITFGNREGLLPPRPRGYYREYTVPTPGESDRGARRIVVGENGAMYYTEDHYASFRRIEE